MKISEISIARSEYLVLCYKKSDGSTRVIINMFDVGQELNFDKNQTKLITDYLKGEGLLEYKTLDGGICLTHMGVKKAENILSESDDSNLIIEDSYSNHITDNVTLKTENNQFEENNNSVHGNINIQIPNPRIQAYAQIRSNQNDLNISPVTLSDKPVSFDLDSLDHKAYAEAIFDFVYNSSEDAPLTIAITGPWGSGKTSLMREIKRLLETSDKSYKAVWFSAWKYDCREAIWAALATTIIKDVYEKSPILKFKLSWHRFSEAFLQNRLIKLPFIVSILSFLIFIVIWTVSKINSYTLFFEYLNYLKNYWAIASIPFYPFFLIMIPIFKTLRTPFLKLFSSTRGPNYNLSLGFQHEFEKDFKELLNLATFKKPPLIIFIDDLDRAPVPIPVKVIEAMNIMISDNKCIFIIGLDLTLAAASIETEYLPVIERLSTRKNGRLNFTGKHFIEKIIQLSFAIPTPTKKQIDNYLNSILKRSSPIEENLINIQKNNEVDKKRHNTDTKSSIEALKDSPELLENIGSLSVYLPKNPRKIKRFINVFRLLAFIANRKKLVTSKDALFELGAVVITALEYPEIHSILYRSTWKYELNLIKSLFTKRDEVALSDIGLDYYSLESQNIGGLIDIIRAIDNINGFLFLASTIIESKITIPSDNSNRQ